MPKKTLPKSIRFQTQQNLETLDSGSVSFINIIINICLPISRVHTSTNKAHIWTDQTLLELTYLHF